MEALVTRLAERAQTARTNLDKLRPAIASGSKDEADWIKYDGLLQTSMQKITSARDALAASSPDLTDVSRLYEDARKALDPILAVNMPGGGFLGGAKMAQGGKVAEAIQGNAPPSAASEKPLPPFEKLVLRLPSVDTLNNAILLNEVVISFIAFVLAIALGMNILYFNNPTWGGWSAYIAAFAWGLGFQQVTGQTVDGLKGTQTLLETKNT